jgi:transcription initiation factor IIE alpha subunit
MGRGICIECTNCQFEETFLEGLGDHRYSSEEIIESIAPREREEVRTIFENHNVLMKSAVYRIYMCPECKKVFSNFWVQIVYDEDREVYTTVFTCPDCGVKLEDFDDDKDSEQLSQRPCPSCGLKTLRIKPDTMIMWD